MALFDMSRTDDTPVMSRPAIASEIPASGIDRLIEADPEERAELVARLDLVGLERLRLDYTLAPAGHGRFRLTGRWSAHATQTCGVTLDPITHAFDEMIDVQFWTPEFWQRRAETSGDVAFGPDEETPEIIEDDTIDPGRLLEELLIVALPPFPRREDAQLNWRDNEGGAASPFAVLQGLSTRDRS
jgi:uncharacterized metal-binding protein YceD (DUF177 family)